MKIISFFNHKGGVSKTTTTYHLGWKLSQKGKRVLLVDADSQCNLTLLAIGQDQYKDFFEKNPVGNIKSYLSYAFESRPELIPSSAKDCISIKQQRNLFLLPGSFDITEFESQLSVSFQLSNAFTTMKNLPGSIYYLLRETAEELKIDYILVDLNPSLSALNQDFIVSSDYFIIPLSTDYFSLMAIKSIARVLPSWEKWAKNARKVFNDSIYPLPKQTPKFLGYTNNDFTTSNNKPAKVYTEMFDKIKKTVTNELVPNLKEQDMLLPQNKYPNGYCLANIGYFQTLQARYQEFGVPVFALSNQQIDTTGKLLQDLNNRQRVFDDEYSNFADKILKITSDE